MRSLEARLSRLEKKQKKASIPTEREYLDARYRQRRRHCAVLKVRIFGDDEGWELKESDRKIVETPPEVIARDEAIIERWEQIHGPTKEERARRAEEVRQKFEARAEEIQKLRAVGKV